MFAYLRAGLMRSSSGVPRSVLIWPYSLLRWVIAKRLKSVSAEVWLRNSLALDYWEFGLSDLDLSVWVQGGAKEAMAAWKSVQENESLLLGGEVQVYASDFCREFLSYANPWEIRREPHLLKKLGWNWHEGSEIQKAVFLAKMLQADKSVRIDPSIRQRKWRDHLSALGKKTKGQIDWSALLEFLRSFEPFQKFSSAELSEVLYKKTHKLDEAGDLERLIRANHHVWGGEAVEADKEFLNRSDDKVHEFLFEMVCWEIWGLSPLTQVTRHLTSEQLRGHLSNQRRLIDMLRVSDSKKQNLEQGLRRLEDFYAPIIHQF